jgi:hypothetical protein
MAGGPHVSAALGLVVAAPWVVVAAAWIVVAAAGIVVTAAGIVVTAAGIVVTAAGIVVTPPRIVRLDRILGAPAGTLGIEGIAFRMAQPRPRPADGTHAAGTRAVDRTNAPAGSRA